jgi:hypothetical protein
LYNQQVRRLHARTARVLQEEQLTVAHRCDR